MYSLKYNEFYIGKKDNSILLIKEHLFRKAVFISKKEIEEFKLSIPTKLNDEEGNIHNINKSRLIMKKCFLF